VLVIARVEGGRVRSVNSYGSSTCRGVHLLNVVVSGLTLVRGPYVCVYRCPRRNVPYFGRMFLMLKYTDITQNTYIQS